MHDMEQSKEQLLAELKALRQRVATLEAAGQSPTQGTPSPRDLHNFGQAALDSLSTNIAIADASGAIIAVNAAWRHFAAANGFRKANYGIGMNYLTVCDTARGHDAEYARQAGRGIREVMSHQRQSFSYEYPCHSSKEKRWFRMSVTRFVQDESDYAVLAHENISQRIDAEQTLREAQTMLERRVAERTAALQGLNEQLQADIAMRKSLEEQLRQAKKMEAMGALAGGIAHDFNNILAAIIGYTELVTDDMPRHSPSRQYLQEVLLASNRAKELVQQILMFSRQHEIEKQPVRVAMLVRETLQLIRASLPSTIEIHANVPEESGTVLADVTQLHQVLMNLCTNAEHAMRATGGVLQIRVNTVDIDEGFAAQHTALHAGPHVRFLVQDTGHGIPPDVLKRIFDPFFTTKDVGEGTGMGLAMVHGIITNHGGAITVESALGQGTTVTIYLPRLEDNTTALTNPGEEPIPHGSGRILFVDDEETLTLLGQATLEWLGYEVVTSLNSIEALHAFRSNPHQYDLVITDQTMPRMTGEQLTQELRRIRPDIPIVLCTGYSHVMDADRAQALGINAFCMKPLTARDLAVTVQQVLSARST